MSVIYRNSMRSSCRVSKMPFFSNRKIKSKTLKSKNRYLRRRKLKKSLCLRIKSLKQDNKLLLNKLKMKNLKQTLIKPSRKRRSFLVQLLSYFSAKRHKFVNTTILSKESKSSKPQVSHLWIWCWAYSVRKQTLCQHGRKNTSQLCKITSRTPARSQ